MKYVEMFVCVLCLFASVLSYSPIPDFQECVLDQFHGQLVPDLCGPVHFQVILIFTLLKTLNRTILTNLGFEII